MTEEKAAYEAHPSRPRWSDLFGIDPNYDRDPDWLDRPCGYIADHAAHMWKHEDRRWWCAGQRTTP